MSGIDRKSSHLTAKDLSVVDEHKSREDSYGGDGVPVVINSEPCPSFAGWVVDMPPIKPVLLTISKVPVQNRNQFLPLFHDRNSSNLEGQWVETSEILRPRKFPRFSLNRSNGRAPL